MVDFVAIDSAEAPAAIGRLLAWLGEMGYSLARCQSAGRANQFARYEDPDRAVSITVDRGDWSLSVGLRSMEAGFHPDEWEAWLDRFNLAGDLSDLEHQVNFLTTRWHAATQRAIASPRAESEIRDIGADYVARRFGFRL